MLSSVGDALSQGYKDVNDFGNNLGDSFAHHVANLPVGLAQLGMHGANAVSGGSLQDSTSAYDKWVQDREKAYQQSVPDSTGSYAGASLGEVLPWATGIGEARAIGLLPEATKLGSKLGLLGAEGGAMGATQPVTDGGQNYGSDKAKQVAIGTATGPLLYGLSAGADAAGKGIGNVVQHVTNPQAIADANIAKLYGSTPDVVAKL